MSGHIYLVQEREFIRLNEDTYKIGKTTKDPNSRLVKYPKHSKVLLVIAVDDCHKTEKCLIEIFKLKYKKMDYGNEYFKGDLKCMMRTIYNHVFTNQYLPPMDKGIIKSSYKTTAVNWFKKLIFRH